MAALAFVLAQPCAGEFRVAPSQRHHVENYKESSSEGLTMSLTLAWGTYCFFMELCFMSFAGAQYLMLVSLCHFNL